LAIRFCWAAAAGYCRHETGGAAKHFGHHEHQYRAASGGVSKDLKDSTTKTLAGAEGDCGICHLSTAQLLVTAQVHITPFPLFARQGEFDAWRTLVLAGALAAMPWPALAQLAHRRPNFAERQWARSRDICSVEAIRVHVQLLVDDTGHLESNSRPGLNSTTEAA
jgi:hypothetical protein